MELFNNPIADLTEDQLREEIEKIRKDRRGDSAPLYESDVNSDNPVAKKPRAKRTKSTKGPSKGDIMGKYTDAFAKGKITQDDYVLGLAKPLDTWAEFKEKYNL